MDEILKYFPELTSLQRAQFGQLGQLYPEWNSQINVVSRKDIDNLYVHHILHSLAIAKFFTPVGGTAFMDLGTGGGFPGIPLAILWPDCRFHLIDRIAKKLKVAKSVAEAVGLTNVTFQHGDSAECKQKFDYVVSRAVMSLPDLVKAAKRNIGKGGKNKLPSGLLCLKGGDLDQELNSIHSSFVEVPIHEWFDIPFFETKRLIYVQL